MYGGEQEEKTAVGAAPHTAAAARAHTRVVLQTPQRTLRISAEFREDHTHAAAPYYA